MNLRYEPSLKPLHISAKQLFLNQELYLAPHLAIGSALPHCVGWCQASSCAKKRNPKTAPNPKIPKSENSQIENPEGSHIQNPEALDDTGGGGFGSSGEASAERFRMAP